MSAFTRFMSWVAFSSFRSRKVNVSGIRWNLKIKAPKSDTMVETKAVAYFYWDVYRICFTNQKQKYYFEIPYTEDMNIQEEAEKYFISGRNLMSVAKCVRCSKWHVKKGQFCERCERAKNTGNTEFTTDV